MPCIDTIPKAAKVEMFSSTSNRNAKLVLTKRVYLFTYITEAVQRYSSGMV